MGRGDGSIYLRGRTYWTCVYVNGESVRESTEETDEAAARKVLRDRIKRVHSHEVTGEVFESVKMKKFTVDEAFELLEDRWTLDGKATKKNLSHLKQAREAFGSYRVAQLDAGVVDDFAKERLEDGYARATVNRILLILHRALKMAVNGKRIARVPHFEYLNDAENVRTDHFADEAELESVISNLPADLQDYTRWCAAIGMRKSEAAALTWTMLDENLTFHFCESPSASAKTKRTANFPSSTVSPKFLNGAS